MKTTLFKKLLRTSYVRGRISNALVYILACVLRLHLCSLSMMLIPDFLSFFWLNVSQITMSVAFYLMQDFFWGGVYVYKKSITNRVVKPLTRISFEQWKLLQKVVLLLLSLYLCIVFLLIEITSNILIIYTLQTLVVTFICDYLDEKKHPTQTKEEQEEGPSSPSPNPLPRELYRQTKKKSKWMLKRLWRKYVIPKRI